MGKICFKCNVEKELSCFYRHTQMRDGHLNKCKDCTKLDGVRHRREHSTAVRKYDRERSRLEHRVASRRRTAEKWKTDPALRQRAAELRRMWRINNAVKWAAHVITGHAIRDGKLIRGACEVCGEGGAEAHHDDYNKPLDVRWLCKLHHTEHHNAERDAARRRSD